VDWSNDANLVVGPTIPGKIHDQNLKFFTDRKRSRRKACPNETIYTPDRIVTLFMPTNPLGSTKARANLITLCGRKNMARFLESYWYSLMLQREFLEFVDRYSQEDKLENDEEQRRHLDRSLPMT
jgi:hypothetical protein